MEDAGIIDNAMTFLEKLRDPDVEFVQVKFTKKDGSERLMKCTLNFDKIPRTDQPKSVNLPRILKLLKDNGIIHVYDLEKQGWRSVPFRKTEWLMTDDNKRYRIRPRG